MSGFSVLEPEPPSEIPVEAPEYEPLLAVRAICHNEDCFNLDKPVILYVPDEPTLIMCGACNSAITDAELAPEEENVDGD